MKKCCKKLSLSTIGLLQAIGLIAYCSLVATVMWGGNSVFTKSTLFLNIVFLLLLLVFSAAVAGSLVFGYAAYLALNDKIKDGLKVLGYTLLYSLGFIFIIAIIVLVIQ